MPFIDAKISMTLSQEQKDSLKTKFGKAVAIIHKPESYLMVGIQDNYSLYMGGKNLPKGAFISVSLFGQASSSDYSKMTAELCKIMEEELGIPGNCVYVTYQGIDNWGWNGQNF